MYCDDVRLCCAHKMLQILHGAPYAVCVELKNLYLFVFCFGVFFCFVCGSGNVRSWGRCCWGGAVYGSLGDKNMWGESGRVGCIRSRV